MFQKATRQKSKLRLCVSGPSGSGKTTGALLLADAIKCDGRVALVDTENGSASLYANKFDFDVLNMEPPFNPVRFVELIKSAEESGYTVIVIDSATHEWDGAGGCLEMNEQTARAKFRGNTWSAWSDTAKEHQKFIDAIVHSSSHVICTARSKTETAQEGKKIMRLGTKLVQRDNFEYEFTLALDLVHDGHYANAIKDRTGIFADKPPQPITRETGELILSWLNDGKSTEEVLISFIADMSRAQDIESLTSIYKSGSASLIGDSDSLKKLKDEATKNKLKLQPEETT